MQSRWNSFVEQVFNVGSGFIISLLFWVYVVVPVWDLNVDHHENLQITAAFTVLSVVRGFIWRRIFNKYDKKECRVEHCRCSRPV
jgi:hypothetical protein